MFISYSQNFEDCMLWRVLQNEGPGFYFDIGGFDPQEHSVTKAFYDRGWRGVNVEPIPDLYENFCKARPDDINLAVAISNKSGKETFYDILQGGKLTGLSTLDPDIAEHHVKTNAECFSIMKREVDVITATEIFNQYGREPFHFLKIDVEGAEKSVLEGLDLKSIRPWIILIEAVFPGQQEVTYNEWESILTSQGYHFVYFDGLNRFYLSEERYYLKKFFEMPPNVFDGIVPAELHLYRQKSLAELLEIKADDAAGLDNIIRENLIQKHQLEKKALQDKIDSLNNQLLADNDKFQVLNDNYQQLVGNYHAMCQSKAWKVVLILRRLSCFFRNKLRSVRHLMLRLLKYVVKRLVVAAYKFINKFPRLKNILSAFIGKFPRLKLMLVRVCRRRNENIPFVVVKNESELTHRGVYIYRKLVGDSEDARGE